MSGSRFLLPSFTKRLFRALENDKAKIFEILAYTCFSQNNFAF